ncbi:hypothetical protein MTR67_001936, partial [Solanum verrucosum]
MSVLYHPGKPNVVADVLSRLLMGSVAHIEDDKKKLVQDVHRLVRLGVQLVDSTKGRVIVHNGRCGSPIVCFEVGEVAFIGPKSVHEAMEKVWLLRERLKTDQSRQKSSADVR